jgi:hypothetical protein
MSAMDELDRKRYMNTNFGPEQSEQRSKLQDDQIVHTKDYLRQALESQIQEKRDTFITRSIKERAEDKQALEVIKKIK